MYLDDIIIIPIDGLCRTECPHTLLGTSAEMNCKTAQMSVHTVSTFQNPKALRPLGRGRQKLARKFYGSGGTKLLGSGNLNFGPCTTRGDPKLSRVGREDLPRPGCLSLFSIRYQ